MPFRRPTPDHESELHAAAARWQSVARRSGRLTQQADLLRGQREVFQLKILLEGSRPPIWRRVLVPADLKLHELHGVIQLAMGWKNEHMYQFRVGTRQESYRCFGDTLLMDVDLWSQAEGLFIDDEGVPIDHLLLNEKDWIRYDYDFGDGWCHRLTLERILVRPLREARIPRCTAGRRACPPEDIGGIPGYARALAVLADPDHPEHEELREWLEGDADAEAFDSEGFDREAVNAKLLEAFTPKPGARAAQSAEDSGHGDEGDSVN